MDRRKLAWNMDNMYTEGLSRKNIRWGHRALVLTKLCKLTLPVSVPSQVYKLASTNCLGQPEIKAGKWPAIASHQGGVNAFCAKETRVKLWFSICSIHPWKRFEVNVSLTFTKARHPRNDLQISLTRVWHGFELTVTSNSRQFVYRFFKCFQTSCHFAEVFVSSAEVSFAWLSFSWPSLVWLVHVAWYFFKFSSVRVSCIDCNWG